MGKRVCCQIQPTIAFVLSHSVKSNSCDPMDGSPPGPSCPWDPPGKNAGVGCHFLLQEIFPTQDGPGVSCISCLGMWVLGVSPPFFFCFFFPTFWPCHTVCGILVSPTKSIEPRPPRVKVQSFNLWTAKEVPPLGDFSDWFPLPSPAVFSATTLVSPQAVEEEALVYFHVSNPVDLPLAGSLRLYLPLW